MPVGVRKARNPKPGCLWEIYSIATGRREGCSATKRKAQISAGIKNRAHARKGKK